MTFEEIRKQWQSEVARPAATVDPQQLLADAQRRVGSLERGVFWRDVREIMAAVFVVCAFGAAWPLYRSSLVATLGVAVIVFSAPVIIYILLAANRRQSGEFATSVLDFSRQRLVWLDRQIRLLQTIFWWYVAPLSLGCMLVGWGLTPGRWWMFWQLAALCLGVAVLTVWLNRRAVRNELLPARRELVELIESLETTSGQ
ncbi:MAG TPA: hypothetical protein VGJ26_18260 [Pirellulales bacterium]|jgi:hypothetical protein